MKFELYPCDKTNVEFTETRLRHCHFACQNEKSFLPKLKSNQDIQLAPDGNSELLISEVGFVFMYPSVLSMDFLRAGDSGDEVTVDIDGKLGKEQMTAVISKDQLAKPLHGAGRGLGKSAISNWLWAIG